MKLNYMIILISTLLSSSAFAGWGDFGGNGEQVKDPVVVDIAERIRRLTGNNSRCVDKNGNLVVLGDDIRIRLDLSDDHDENPHGHIELPKVDEKGNKTRNFKDAIDGQHRFYFIGAKSRINSCVCAGKNIGVGAVDGLPEAAEGYAALRAWLIIRGLGAQVLAAEAGVLNAARDPRVLAVLISIYIASGFDEHDFDEIFDGTTLTDKPMDLPDGTWHVTNREFW